MLCVLGEIYEFSEILISNSFCVFLVIIISYRLFVGAIWEFEYVEEQENQKFSLRTPKSTRYRMFALICDYRSKTILDFQMTEIIRFDAATDSKERVEFWGMRNQLKIKEQNA